MEKIYWVSTINPETLNLNFWFYSTLTKAEEKACKVSEKFASISNIYLLTEGEELDQAELLETWKEGKWTYFAEEES